MSVTFFSFYVCCLCWFSLFVCLSVCLFCVWYSWAVLPDVKCMYVCRLGYVCKLASTLYAVEIDAFAANVHFGLAVTLIFDLITLFSNAYPRVQYSCQVSSKSLH